MILFYTLQLSWSRPYVTRGVTFLFVNNLQRSLDDTEKALTLNHTGISAITLHGVVFLKLGRGREGLSEFERVSAAHPNNPKLHTNIGWILVRDNMPNEALPFLTNSIGLHPNDKGRAYFLRAQAYRLIGKKQKALEDLRMAARQGNQRARERL